MSIVTIKLPQFGMSMQDGEIVRWHNAVGDFVRNGEPLVEIETSKTVVDVPSPFDGELVAILANPGETVEVGAPIAELRIK
jgi:pyruvate/2-oxoglutarate dehydrogenase complex dihydrolipoamide acyltransferase (E2) component